MCRGFERSSDRGLTISGLGSVDPALNEDTPCSPTKPLASFSLSHPSAALAVVFFAGKYGFVVAFDTARERSTGVEGKNSSAGGSTRFCLVGCEELTGLRVIDGDLEGLD